jgi:hypothetical protein
MADATLEAGACLLTQDTKEFDFFNEILSALMHVGESTDGSPRQMGCCSGQISIFFICGQRIGHGGCPDMWGGGRMSGHVLYFFSLVVNDWTYLTQTFHVFGSVFYLHAIFFLPFFIIKPLSI